MILLYKSSSLSTSQKYQCLFLISMDRTMDNKMYTPNYDTQITSYVDWNYCKTSPPFTQISHNFSFICPFKIKQLKVLRICFCLSFTWMISFALYLTYPGILRDKIMPDKLMYILNDDSKNYPFYRLQLVIEMFGHST